MLCDVMCGKTTSVKMAANKFLQNKNSEITDVFSKDFADLQGDVQILITYLNNEQTQHIAFGSNGVRRQPHGMSERGPRL